MITFLTVVYIKKCGKWFGIKRIKRNCYFVAWQVLEKLKFLLRAEICQELSKLTGRKRKPQSKYSDEDRYTIAKYAKDNGASKAAKFFKNKYPTINKSTVRTFVKKYDENVKVAKACGRSPDNKLKTLCVEGL